ncbi:tetratricopeptide repeat protein [uncultured Desulfobacter sp.]|uniref:tetratricopeptide repeat protein n=1 Tax=uncultured Desulfobacter sp. TaxID=240139 RepID=UPI002AAC08DB|nr:tetratricopeptide repeat protein [uncultured Desulfobacter sp.]
MKTCSPIIISLLIILISCTGCANKEEKKATYIRKGNEYFDAKEYRKAEIEFRNASEIDNTDTAVLLKLGEIFMKTGRLKMAFTLYSSVVKLDPENIEALIKLAQFYFLDRRLPEAKARIEIVLNKAPRNLDALFLKGQILLKRKQIEDAQAVFEKILEIQDNYMEALHAMAAVKTLQKKFGEAEALLLRAVASTKDAMKARITLAQFYIIQKQLDKAEEQLDLSAAESPENAVHQMILGSFYLKTKNLQKAEAAFKKAVEIEPDSPRTLLTIAEFYAFTDKKDQALKWFKKAASLDPENSNTHMALARFQYKEKKINEAEILVDDILNKRPKLPDARILKSEILIFKKEFQSAFNILTPLGIEDPKSYKIQYFKALCCIGLGELPQAASAALRAVDLKPEYIQARLLLSEIYLRQQSFDLAVNQASVVIKADPKLYRAYLIRGKAYTGLKKFKDAENDYNQMIQIAPDDLEGYYNLALFKSLSGEFDQVAPLLEKVRSLNNKFPGVFFLSIRNALAQRDFDGAQAICLRYMEIFKDNNRLKAMVMNTRATLYMTQKDLNHAELELHKAIDLDPDYLNSYGTLAKVYLAQKNIDSAKKQYLTMIEKNSRFAPPHMLLAVLYEAQENYSEAEMQYRKALEIDPNYFAAANNLAFLLASRTDKLDEALALAKFVKARQPEDPSVMDTMGFVYYKKGFYGNAVSELLDCMEKTPDNPIVRYHLGLAYYGKGEKKQALKELTKALEQNEDFPWASDAKKLIKEIKKG